MADEVLAVDKAVFDAEIGKLKTLIASTELSDAISDLENSIPSCTGESAGYIRSLHFQLEWMNRNISLLFSNTLAFLESKYVDFSQADH